MLSDVCRPREAGRSLVPVISALHGDAVGIRLSFPRGRGRILTIEGEAVIAANCPLCGDEHRYAKGAIGGPEIEEIRRRGFTDEWLPCQRDLPGNYWRVTISSGEKSSRPGGRRSRKATSS